MPKKSDLIDYVESIGLKKKEEKKPSPFASLLDPSAPGNLLQPLSMVINPFKATPPPAAMGNLGLVEEYGRQSRKVLELATVLKERSVRREAAKKISGLEAMAANAKTVPMDVLYRFAGAVTEQERETLQQLDLALYFDNYKETINQLQNSYSFINNINQSLWEANERVRAHNGMLFNAMVPTMLGLAFKLV